MFKCLCVRCTLFRFAIILVIQDVVSGNLLRLHEARYPLDLVQDLGHKLEELLVSVVDRINDALIILHIVGDLLLKLDHLSRENTR